MHAMEARLLSTLVAFLTVSDVLMSCKAASPAAETYWKQVLHNTPMPKPLKDSLQLHHPNDGVVVIGGKGGKKTSVSVGKGGPTVVVSGPKGKHAYVRVKPNPHSFVYRYAPTETQLKDEQLHTAVFFHEKDLKPTNTMNLHFTPSTSPAPFIPRQVADATPFSSAKLPEILRRLSIHPGSPEATTIQTTLRECEEKPIGGEDKRCATSLEAMVDYVTSKLGTRVSATSTEMAKKGDKEQKYKIMKVTRLGFEEGQKAPVVVCHKQSYAYAVFYCHETTTTRAYKVSLVGEGGGKVDAVAVCHTDTSKWNPKHLAFMVLKVKPGTVPVCHFLPQDHIVWVRK